MTSAGPPTPPTRVAEVFRRPGLRMWVLARLTSGIGATMLRAVFLWQVYQLSKSTAILGLMGLLSFLPAPISSLVGGMIADAFDRRRVVLAAQLVGLSCAVALAALSASGHASVPLLLAIIVVNATASAFEAPARQAMLPSLVPMEEFSRAVTLMSTVMALAFVSGPAIGGVLVATSGVSTAYAIAAGLYALAIACVLAMKALRVAATRKAISISGLLEGLRFLKSQPAILGAMSIDLFAVIFGGATALLPVYATEVLDVGAHGYGVLSSSLEIGALSTSIALLLLPPIRRVGRAIVLSVVVYGLATITFGLSRSFPLSIAAYVLVGMADQVSVVSRSMLVQTSTPDELRGRVSSVNMIFIGASNQLSAAEAGFVAALVSPTFSVVSGGAMVLVVAVVVALFVPRLLRFEAPGAPG